MPKYITPEILESDDISFMDADDELMDICSELKISAPHQSQLERERIKFLYTWRPKKEGGKYVIGGLYVRSEMERMISEGIDYILLVYYPLWKELDDRQKLMQLDKLLCGISIEVNEKTNKEMIKKSTFDSKEYIDNIKHWGTDEVIKESEKMDMSIRSIIENKKNQKKNDKQERA